MVKSALADNPERTAWTVLLSAFLVLVSIIAGALFGGQWWLRNATRPQGIGMVGSGTVLVTQPGRTTAEVNLASFPAGSRVATDAIGQAYLTFTSSDGRQVLATVRMFGNTEIEVVQADSPRYQSGTGPHQIVIYINSGRVRATMGVDLDREVRIEIRSEPGALTVVDEPGSNVSLEATRTQTMVTVRDGFATVSAYNGRLVLKADERSVVAPGLPPSGPLTGEQNWIVNGDFADPLNGEWRRTIAQPAVAEETPGTVEVVTITGRRVVQLSRVGTTLNWGRAGITQQIDRDVQGYSSLRLNLDVFITQQDVPNCGVFGTECPLMVRIEYIDVGGSQGEWLQGFYYFFDSNPVRGLTYCATCAVRFEHLQWPQAKWQVHNTPNLLEVFAAAGTPAARIRSITVYGEGHSFNSMVTDIQLLATE